MEAAETVFRQSGTVRRTPFFLSRDAMNTFFVKKILSYILYPFPLTLLLLFGGFFLFWRKKTNFSKICIGAGLALLLIQSMPIIPNEITTRLEYHCKSILTPSDIPSDVKWVVVLSGSSTDNQYVTLTSRNIGDTLHRLVEGIILAQQIPESKLLLSGGSVLEPTSAAKVMSDMAQELHFPATRIVTEELSRDTEEQAGYIAQIVKKEPILLVTSAMHMPRSVMEFEHYGIKVIPAPTVYTSTTHPGIFMLFPSAKAMLDSQNAVHELLGIIWFKIKLGLGLAGH
jgi:uncharacterized SAM-binding protein YcdF (DUF218 family)